MLPAIDGSTASRQRKSKRSQRKRTAKTGPCCFLSRSGQGPTCVHEQARLRKQIHNKEFLKHESQEEDIKISGIVGQLPIPTRQQKRQQKHKRKRRKRQRRQQYRPLETFDFGKQTSRAQEHSFVRNIRKTQRQRPKTPTWDMKHWHTPHPLPPGTQQRNKRQREVIYEYQDNEYERSVQHSNSPPPLSSSTHTIAELVSLT